MELLKVVLNSGNRLEGSTAAQPLAQEHREINKRIREQRESLEEKAIVSTPLTLRGMWLNQSFMILFAWKMKYSNLQTTNGHK